MLVMLPTCYTQNHSKDWLFTTAYSFYQLSVVKGPQERLHFELCDVVIVFCRDGNIDREYNWIGERNDHPNIFTGGHSMRLIYMEGFPRYFCTGRESSENANRISSTGNTTSPLIDLFPMSHHNGTQCRLMKMRATTGRPVSGILLKSNWHSKQTATLFSFTRKIPLHESPIVLNNPP